MSFQWDPSKAKVNFKKHGVHFADAVIVLSDDRAITIQDDYPDEDRFITIGMDELGRVLVVVYIFRGDRLEISQPERQQLESVNSMRSKT